jgi:hypothetical protein
MLRIAVLSVAACAIAPHATFGQTVETDSAGVRVVHLTPSEFADSAHLAAEPTWSLDFVTVGAEEHYFSSGISVFPLGDDLLAIADPATRTVLVGAPGRGWAALGGRGDGPGELRQLTVARPSASGGVWLMDRPRDRLVELSAEGDLLSDAPLPHGDLATENWWPLGETHWFLGGNLGVQRSYELGSVVMASRPIVRVTPTGTDSLSSYPVREWFFSEGSFGPTLLAPRAYAAGTPAGYWVGYGGDSEIHRWSDEVDLVVRWTRVERDLRPAADRALDQFFAAAPAFQTTPQARAVYDAWPVTSHVPQFTGLVPVADGGVGIGPVRESWLEAVVPAPRPEGDWWVLGPDGLLSTVVRVHEGFVPTFFGPDYVLGVFKDDLDREFAQRREIVRYD